MMTDAWDIVKRYTSPGDYFSLVCVSKEFHKIFKGMEGPVMLSNLLRNNGIDKHVASAMQGPELLGILSRVFDGYQPNGYHAGHLKKLRMDLKFDGLASD